MRILAGIYNARAEKNIESTPKEALSCLWLVLVLSAD
jgi:hypothetical protein